MDRKEAEAEAQRRWGEDGQAYDFRDGAPVSGYVYCAVGVLMEPYYRGEGPTFEAAFADADRRAKPDAPLPGTGHAQWIADTHPANDPFVTDPRD